MPDARASRKRQIQITPRLYRDAGASRAFLTNGRYPVSRVWAHLSGLCGLQDTVSGSAIGTTCAKRDPASGGVLRVFASRARSKSREIDSISPGGSIRFHPHRGSGPLRGSAGAAALHRCEFAPGNLGLPSSFAGFCPGWGVHRRRDASRGLPPHAMSLVRCLYNGCVIARCGFGDLACDSVREGRAGGHRPLVAVRARTIAVSVGSIRKYAIKTVPCG